MTRDDHGTRPRVNREPATEAVGRCHGLAPFTTASSASQWSHRTAVQPYCGSVGREGPPPYESVPRPWSRVAVGRSRLGHSLKAPAPHCAAPCGALTKTCWTRGSLSGSFARFLVVQPRVDQDGSVELLAMDGTAMQCKCNASRKGAQFFREGSVLP